MPPRSPFRVDPFEYPPDDDAFAPTRYAIEHAVDNDYDENAPPEIRELHVPPPPPERPGTKGPVCLADVPSSDLDWLWPGRIPLGKLTLLVGDPGAGKSLVALDVAARVTSGAPWPDAAHCGFGIADCGLGDAQSSASEANPHSEIRNPQSPPSPTPHSVLLLSAEDDLAATIRPRLQAAGADLARIIAIPAGWSAEDPKSNFYADRKFVDRRPLAERPAPPRPFDLRHDLGTLENLLAQRPACRLIIIDPLSAYLGSGVDNFHSEVRRRLAPLAALAERRRVAILAISHLRKQSGTAIHRTVGSLAFTAAARASWLIAKDPNDPDRRLMLPVKNNLAATVGTLSFTVKQSETQVAPIVEWSPDTLTLTADEALRPPPRGPGRPDEVRDDARRWLQQALAAGARQSREIEEAAAANGLRLHTLRRAFRDLGGEAVRHGFGPFGQWFWRLPGVGDQEPKFSPDALWPYSGPEPGRAPRQ